jgi:hypothetical protein
LAVELAQQLTQKIKASKGVVGDLTPETFSSNALLHELQLGEQLNHSVEQTRRADFSLMLAMLAEDVREQSQFLLPKTKTAPTTEATNKALRKAFNLPEQESLSLNTLDDINQFNEAQAIVDNDLATIKLSNAMKPKPLAFRDDKQHISTNVIENTSLFTQLKYKQSQLAQVNRITDTEQATQNTIDKPISEMLNFNAKAWLDGIEQSLVKAPLLN